MASQFVIPDITFVVFTFNEAARLPDVIKNFRKYGGILVVDNFSTDETVAIARAAGCEVLMNKNAGWVEDFETTEKVKATVQTPWIYWAFADEIIAQDVLMEIKHAVEANTFDIISVMRKNYFYGQFCHEIAATYQIKAFKKAAIDFRNNTIHNFGRIIVAETSVYRIPSNKYVHHLISNTVASYLTTISRYTDVETNRGSADGKRRTLRYFLLQPIKAIWGDYFLRGGRKAGQPAWTLSILVMMYGLITAMKAWERQHGFDSGRIAERYQQVTDALLQGIGE